MQLLLEPLLMLLIFYSVGQIFIKKEDNYIHALPLGFAVVNILFLSLIILGVDIDISNALVLIFISICFFLNIYSGEIFKNINIKLVVVATLIFVIMYSSWPYFFSEGRYFHTGALDLILDQYSKTNDVIEGGLSNIKLQIAIQYTSMAFVSMNSLFSDTIVTYLSLSIVLLVISIIGIYNFAKILIDNTYKSHNVLYILSIITILSSFYIGTYLNYHLGTLIYISIIFFLFSVSIKSNKKFFDYILIIIYILLLIYTYRIIALLIYFIPIFLAALLINTDVKIKKIYIFYQKRYYILLILITICSFFIALEKYGLQGIVDYPGFRAWELIKTEYMLGFFYGIVPSMLMGKGYLLIDVFESKFILKIIMFMLISIFVFVTVRAISKNMKDNIIVDIMIKVWLVMFTLFYFIVSDPYYVYKLLYLTYPIIIFITLFMLYEKKNFTTLLLFVIINLASTIYMNIQVYNMNYSEIYNKFKKEVVNLNINNISDISIIGGNQSERTILRSILNEDYNTTNNFNFDKNSKYIIELDDITKYCTNASNSELVKCEKKDKYIIVDDFFHQKEQDGKQTTRWIYDRNSSKGWIKLTKSIYNKEDYIGIYYSTVPTLSHEIMNLTIQCKKKSIDYEIKNVGILFVKNKNFNCEKLILSINSENPYLDNFPIEQRKLYSKFYDINFYDKKFVNKTLVFLNPKNDIANQDFNVSNNILVGNGWYPQEVSNMRWGSTNLELLVMNTTKDNITVELDIEPGPSLKELPLKVNILNESNHKVGYFEVMNRKKIILEIPVENDKRYQILKLEVLNKTKKLETDPRDLNLRVFSIKTIENEVI